MTTSISSEAQKRWMDIKKILLSGMGVKKIIKTKKSRNPTSTPTNKEISMKIDRSVQKCEVI